MNPTFDLMPLLTRFNDVDNFQNETAFFLTRTPTIARQAYLNVLFKPARVELRAEISRKLALTADLQAFYGLYNGACLFGSGLNIYGFRDVGQLLKRSDPFSLPPFDIVKANYDLHESLRLRGLVCFAAYSYDRSFVCSDRESARVHCFVGDRSTETRQTWPTLENWLGSEIARISALFDVQGTPLVPEEQLLPNASAGLP